MIQLTIADQAFAFERATLVAYHCDSSEADWNLGLERQGETLWLSGTIEPGPKSPDDLDGARVRIDLRSLDEVAATLLGRAITMYPGGQSVCKLAFAIRRSAIGVRFAVDFTFEWDDYLKTFPADGTMLSGSLDIDASLGALHPGNLPPG